MEKVIGTLVAIAVLTIVYLCGKVNARSEAAFDCDKYQATYLDSKRYECKPATKWEPKP